MQEIELNNATVQYFTPAEFAELVRTLIKGKGTQEAVAKEIGTTQQTLSSAMSKAINGREVNFSLLTQAFDFVFLHHFEVAQTAQGNIIVIY